MALEQVMHFATLILKPKFSNSPNKLASVLNSVANISAMTFALFACHVMAQVAQLQWLFRVVLTDKRSAKSQKTAFFSNNSNKTQQNSCQK